MAELPSGNKWVKVLESWLFNEAVICRYFWFIRKHRGYFCSTLYSSKLYSYGLTMWTLLKMHYLVAKWPREEKLIWPVTASNFKRWQPLASLGQSKQVIGYQHQLFRMKTAPHVRTDAI